MKESVDEMAEIIKEKEKELYEMKALGYDNSIPYSSNIRWYNF